MLVFPQVLALRITLSAEEFQISLKKVILEH